MAWPYHILLTEWMGTFFLGGEAGGRLSYEKGKYKKLSNFSLAVCFHDLENRKGNPF